MAAMQIEEIQLGWNVYDDKGDKIGDVAEVTPTYVRAKKSGLLGGDCYIPRSAIESVEEHGVYLNVPKSELSDKPPA